MNLTPREKILLAVERGYTAREDGAIWRPRTKQWHFGYVNTCGYRRFALKVNGQVVSIPCHRFNAYVKYGEKIFEDQMVVRHLNGDPIDNNWGNLALGTHSDNAFDMSEEDRKKRAFNSSKATRRFSNKEIEVIREYYKDCRSYKKTKEKFGISNSSSLFEFLNRDYKSDKKQN